jgi:hypothetical protein
MFRLRHSAAALVAAGGVGLTGGAVALACTGAISHSSDTSSVVLSSSNSAKGFHLAQSVDSTPTATPTETTEPTAAPKATETPEPTPTVKPATTTEPDPDEGDVDEANEPSEPDEASEATPAAMPPGEKHDDHGGEHAGGGGGDH